VELVKEIRNKRKRISVFSSDGIETMPVDAQAQGTIFLLDEKDWCTAQGLGLMNESVTEILL
jgi:S-adenosylmethionine:diacylglycerol 3-amino-3-carboxypropyl transferase